jgi:septum formation protein
MERPQTKPVLLLKDLGEDQSLMKLILASTSKYRGELLKLTGLPFSAVSPGVDEDQLKWKGLHPKELSERLALLKAEAVFKQHPEAVVIGSDQVCAVNESILGKPHHRDGAIAQIQKLQGRSHELHTSVSVITPAGVKTWTNTTRLHMRALSQDAIERYVDFDQPYDCAGSYKLESRGISLFEKIEMSDHTSIIGLPLIELTTHLLTLGFSL